MLTKGRVTAAVFIGFLNQCSDAGLRDCRWPSNASGKVRRSVRNSERGKLALFVLPPYSPELNPDEYVWNEIKAHGTGRKLITSLTQLRQTILSHMRQLQKLPGLVRSFIHARTTSYASA